MWNLNIYLFLTLVFQVFFVMCFSLVGHDFSQMCSPPVFPDFFHTCFFRVSLMFIGTPLSQEFFMSYFFPGKIMFVRCSTHVLPFLEHGRNSKKWKFLRRFPWFSRVFHMFQNTGKTPFFYTSGNNPAWFASASSFSGRLEPSETRIECMRQNCANFFAAQTKEISSSGALSHWGQGVKINREDGQVLFQNW